jgi:hypothetical protein
MNTCSSNSPDPRPDRRRHPRYRFCLPLSIRAASGAVIRAISIEISETGLSAIAADSLSVGDTVELEPVCAGTVSALVRHNVGRIYGFEFLNLSSEQASQIVQSCKTRALYDGRALGI